jgi:hypothetical protein
MTEKTAQQHAIEDFIDRWLRPGFQNPTGTSTEQKEVESGDKRRLPGFPRFKSNILRSPWSKSLPEQVRILRDALAAQPAPVTAEAMARQFTRARKDKVEELLQTLVTLGQVREVEGGMFMSG